MSLWKITSIDGCPIALSMESKVVNQINITIAFIFGPSPAPTHRRAENSSLADLATNNLKEAKPCGLSATFRRRFQTEFVASIPVSAVSLPAFPDLRCRSA